MRLWQKKDMNPSLVPCFSRKASLYLLRSCMTGCMSTSLKVVSKAASCCARTSRVAIVRRIMLIGLTSSPRFAEPCCKAVEVAGGLMVGVSAGVTTGAGAGVRLETAFATSSLRTRPPGPVPGTSSALILLSSASRRAAGMTRTSPAGGLAVEVDDEGACGEVVEAALPAPLAAGSNSAMASPTVAN